MMRRLFFAALLACGLMPALGCDRVLVIDDTTRLTVDAEMPFALGDLPAAAQATIVGRVVVPGAVDATLSLDPEDNGQLAGAFDLPADLDGDATATIDIRGRLHPGRPEVVLARFSSPLDLELAGPSN